MKKKVWIWILCVVVLGAVAYGCYRAFASDSYLYALPSRPKVLVAVDWPKLADDSGLGMDGLAALCPGRKEQPKGIDWKKKSYLFVSAKEYVGLLAPVSDADELAAWLGKVAEDGKCSVPEERNGRYWTVWDGSWMVGFDDRALLAIGPGMAAEMDVLRQEVTACLRQKKDESGAASSLFADVDGGDSACRLAAQLDVLSALYGEDFMRGLPEHANLSDVNVVAGLNLMVNGFTLDAEIRSENPEINTYFEQLAVLGGKIDGDYAADVPASALGWCCMNVDGDKLLEQLRRNPAVRTFLLGLNMGVDADLMLRSIRGDLAVTIYPSVTSGAGFLLKARLEDKDFLKEAPYWRESAARSGLAFKDLGGNHFFIATPGMRAYFGVEDKTLYVTPDEGLAMQVLGKKTQTLSGWEKEIKGSRFFLWCNLAQLRGVAGWPAGLDLFGDLVLRSSDARHFTLDMRGTEGRNVWKELLE